MKGFDSSSAAAVAALLDSLDVIAWVADPATLRFAYVNKAGAATLGYPLERWLQEPPFWPVLLDATDRVAMLGLCAAVARDGTERTQLHRVADSAGMVRWFRTKVRRLALPEGGSPQLLGEMVEVSDFVRDREVARENKIWLDLILEQVPGIIWTLDRNFRFTAGAGAGVKLIGLTPEQVVGTSLEDFLRLSGSAGPDMAAHRRALQGEASHYRGHFADFAYEAYVEPLRAGDEIVGVIGIALDVTERATVEAERERLLSESNRRRELLEVVLEHAPIGILVLRGPELRIEVANPAIRALAPSRQLEGRRWYDDVNPELSALRPALEEVLRTGKTSYLVDQPTTVRTTEGGPPEQMWFSSTRVRIQLPDGTPGVLLLVNNTTAAVQARLEIDQLAGISHARAAELQAVLENMADSVTVYGAEGAIGFSNRATFELLGLVPGELVDKSFAGLCKLLDPLDTQGRPVPVGVMPPMRALAGETLTTEISVSQAVTGRRVTVRASASPLKDPLGRITGAVMIARDVTAAFELERLKDQFIEVAAHELKSPVAIMKTNAQLLIETGEGLSAVHLRMAQAIDRGATRIDRIVQNLLDISQLQLNTLVLTSMEVDLVALAQQVIQRSGQAAPRHPIRLTAGRPALVWGDPHRLEWILVHLIDNAIQYSADGGAVDIRIDADGWTVTLSVHDSGEGIPLDRQARIFERFYRAHTRTPRDVGGLGVSLHIAREIIRRLGGEIWFRSEPGKGTTFSFRLPTRKAP